MAKCCICGKEVTPGKDCERLFTGRVKYICFECDGKGHDEVEKHRCNYFSTTYEGRRQLEIGHMKRRGK